METKPKKKQPLLFCSSPGDKAALYHLALLKQCIPEILPPWEWMEYHPNRIHKEIEFTRSRSIRDTFSHTASAVERLSGIVEW